MTPLAVLCARGDNYYFLRAKTPVVQKLQEDTQIVWQCT